MLNAGNTGPPVGRSQGAAAQRDVRRVALSRKALHKQLDVAVNAEVAVNRLDVAVNGAEVDLKATRDFPFRATAFHFAEHLPLARGE